MTTLDLHIGLHKTGTTSLQSLFAANDGILKRFSIVYPRTGRKKNKHNLLAWSLRSVDDLSRLLAALHEECSGSEHALVSCEEFSHAFLDGTVLEQFCRLARERFHVRVIIYLRRQDQLKESVYSEVVRDWFCGSILDENHYEYDHLKRLNLLRAQIPKRDLIVRRHMSSGLEQDFVSIYGLVLANGFKVPPRKRLSPGRRLTAILGRLDKRETQFSARFLGYLGGLDIWEDDGVRYLLSPEQRRTFLRQYEQTNRELAEQYFPELNGTLFEPTESGDTNWSPVSLPPEDECQRLIRSLWDDYNKRSLEGTFRSEQLSDSAKAR